MTASTGIASHPGLTIEYKIHIKKGRMGRKCILKGKDTGFTPPTPGRIPRISRLMALAIHFQHLVEQGGVQDFSELARLGHVSRARLTQIMNLLHLAPDIQEEILFLPNTTNGRDPVLERDLRPISAISHWNRQRKMWTKMTARQMS